jgi:membrane fusion protein (multidrug efflux system)
MKKVKLNYMTLNFNKTNMKNSILILTLVVFIAACGAKSSSDKKTELEKLKKEKSTLDTKIAKLEEEVAKTDTTKKEKLIEVLVAPLALKTFKSYIEVQGRVDAEENVNLSTEMPGTINKINVKVGDHVTKGQVLAETDQRPTEQQLTDLRTNLDLAKQVYDKQKALWDQKIGSELAYLQSKNAKESLENKITVVQEQLRMGKIISPIDGTVDFVDIKLGQVAAPGSNAITVVNFSSLKVKADVAEAYASRIKNGDDVLVYFPDMNDSATSTIHYASRAIKQLTRTFAVEVQLDGKKEFHPNTVAKLKINDYQSPKPELVVPVKFIQKGTEESFVMVDDNGKAVKKVVKTGREYSGMAEILDGLKEGDLLITEGYDLVNEGTQIKAVKQ